MESIFSDHPRNFLTKQIFQQEPKETEFLHDLLQKDVQCERPPELQTGNSLLKLSRIQSSLESLENRVSKVFPLQEKSPY